MSEILHSKKINAIIRIIVGVFFFFATVSSLLFFYAEITYDGLEITYNGFYNKKRTLYQAIIDFPFYLFILLFLFLVIIASIFSFVSGFFSMKKKNNNWTKQLRWDFYFWISMIFIAVPVITGFIAGIIDPNLIR